MSLSYEIEEFCCQIDLSKKIQKSKPVFEILREIAAALDTWRRVVFRPERIIF